ncbi:MAG: WD40 repeat domain-containing protein [Pseudonocardiaceae bacterium]
MPTLYRLGRSSDRHDSAVSALQTVVIEGQPILVSGSMAGELARWSVLPCARLGEPVIVGPGEVSTLACFDDGDGARLVSCSAPSRVQVWDGWLRPERTLHSGRPAATVVAVFDHGTRPTLVTGHNDGSLRLLDPGSGQVSRELPAVQSSYISAMTISGRAVICAGEQGVLTVLDPAADPPAPIDLSCYHDGVAALASAVVGDRPVAISGSEDGTVRLWDLTAARLAATADARASWAASRMVRVGDQLAAVLSNEREIRFMDAVDRTLFGPPIPVDPSTPVTALATVDRAGDLLVATGDNGGEIIIRSVSGTGNQLRFSGHRGWVADAAFTVLDNAPVLATAGHDGMLRCSNLTDGSLARPSIELPEILGTVEALTVTMIDSTPIAAVSTTGRQVQVWDLLLGELVASIKLAEADGAVGVWAAAGTTFVGGTTTGRTIVWLPGTTDVLRSVTSGARRCSDGPGLRRVPRCARGCERQ